MSICSAVQFNLREMHDSWLTARADDIQGSTYKNDTKNFSSSLKDIYGPTNSGSSLLLNVDGIKLISVILER